MENELYTAEIKAVKVDPKKKTFLIEAWIDGFGPVWDQFDAWDYVGIFDGIGLADLIGREVRVKMKPNAYEFIEVVREGELMLEVVRK